MPDRVLYEATGGVATITLNRPEALNAFDEELVRALWKRLLEARGDDEVAAIVLTGAGRGFCAGGDLRALAGADPERPARTFRELAAVFHLVVNEIRGMPKAVIGAINGPAAGGGFSLALACDLRVMSEQAFLQQAYTSSGLALDGGGTYALPRLVGLARAMEIVMLDERIDAAAAERLGLANWVVPAGEVVARAQEIAARIAARPLHATGVAKQLLAQSLESTLGAQLERERIAIATSSESVEGREGLDAFVAKRKPDFVSARRKS